MNRRREIGLFLLVSILICLAVFRGAFWGSRILAPVDIAPAIFSKYRYVDPAAGHVPANHYIIDQLTFDLPLQYTIYRAYRSGEFPWWDPYTFGGRPLLADAHVNGTDPIRVLCYLTLPFVSAYNWNLILKSILSGLSMFLLLRYLRFSLTISLLLALTYQFAGCFAFFFGHPWIQAGFLYYPLLWTVWATAAERSTWRSGGMGALLCALIFYSGNLQSHAYLPLFAFCLLSGYGFGNRKLFLRLSVPTSLSILTGALLAAPVIWPEIEFYLNSLRTASFSSLPRWSVLSGLASFSAVFPWILGTFRTLDIGKVLGTDAIGFVLFIGPAAFVLALFGSLVKGEVPLGQEQARRTAIALGLVYFLVCSTPLLAVLYTRMAPFAVIGLTVLAGFGLSALRDHVFPKLGLAVAATALAIVLILNLGAFAIYPHYINRVRAFVAERDRTNPSFDQTPALRTFQVENLPQEISLRNPETVLAFLSLIGLAVYLGRPGNRSSLQLALLILNFTPVILFYSRYIQNSPTEFWERLVAGGPEQQRVIQALNPNHLRLLEDAPGINEMVFPNNMGHLYQVHTVHGYTALQPPSLFRWPFPDRRPPLPIADYQYSSKERHDSAGEFVRLTNDVNSRIRCSQRKVFITAETLNTLTVSIEPGPAAELFRTDTMYPGWRAKLNDRPVQMRRNEPPFSLVDLPASEMSSTVTYRYRPSHYVLTSAMAIAGGLLVILGLAKRRSYLLES